MRHYESKEKSCGSLQVERERERNRNRGIFQVFFIPPSVDCTGDYETLCTIEGTIYLVESLQRHYAFRCNETLDKSTELLVEGTF